MKLEEESKDGEMVPWLTNWAMTMSKCISSSCFLQILGATHGGFEKKGEKKWVCNFAKRNSWRDIWGLMTNHICPQFHWIRPCWAVSDGGWSEVNEQLDYTQIRMLPTISVIFYENPNEMTQHTGSCLGMGMLTVSDSHNLWLSHSCRGVMLQKYSFRSDQVLKIQHKDIIYTSFTVARSR